MRLTLSKGPCEEFPFGCAPGKPDADKLSLLFDKFFKYVDQKMHGVNLYETYNHKAKAGIEALQSEDLRVAKFDGESHEPEKKTGGVSLQMFKRGMKVVMLENATMHAIHGRLRNKIDVVFGKKAWAVW